MKKKIAMAVALVVIVATLGVMFAGCTGVGTYVLDAGALGKSTIELKMGGKATLDVNIAGVVSYKGEATWKAGEKDDKGNVAINIVYKKDDKETEFPVAFINKDGDLIVGIATFKKQ